MSILQVVRCELYYECKHEFTASFQDLCMPDDWLVLIQGSTQIHTGMHFCSAYCLMRWYVMCGELVPLPAGDKQEQIECKARRFYLVDGETADMYEGVKFGNGHVSIQGLPFTDAPFWFESWESLKEKCPGCGVQWIDREVME